MHYAYKMALLIALSLRSAAHLMRCRIFLGENKQRKTLMNYMTKSQKQSLVHSHTMTHLRGGFEVVPAIEGGEHSSHHITTDFGLDLGRGIIASVRAIPEMNEKDRLAVANLLCAAPEMRDVILSYFGSFNNQNALMIKMAEILSKFNLREGSKLDHLRMGFSLEATMSSDFKSIRYINTEFGEDGKFMAVATVAYGVVTTQEADLATASLFGAAPDMRDAIMYRLSHSTGSVLSIEQVENMMRSSVGLND